MSRLTIKSASRVQTTMEGIYTDMERRIIASPPGICPVDLTAAFLKLCRAQTCGKCVPCRIGLTQIANMIYEVQSNTATMETLEQIRNTARIIEDSADCALGVEAARMILRSLDGCWEDYVEHVQHHHCSSVVTQSIPCVASCPAGVDIPGYVALVEQERYADAVRLIRKDNPLPVACAMICEHPCESRCRRTLLDAPINIRGLKLAAVNFAGTVPAPKCAEPTGKRVAIIGGGPSGLSAAYYLQLMGHQCTIFEKRKHLGGMLRYGIPGYRLPRERLQADIDCILSTGVEVRRETGVGKGEGMISMEKLREDYDAVFISIGAHDDKKLGIPNEDAEGCPVCRGYDGRHWRRNYAGFQGQAGLRGWRRQRCHGLHPKRHSLRRRKGVHCLSPESGGHDCPDRRGAGRTGGGRRDAGSPCAGEH